AGNLLGEHADAAREDAATDHGAVVLLDGQGASRRRCWDKREDVGHESEPSPRRAVRCDLAFCGDARRARPWRGASNQRRCSRSILAAAAAAIASASDLTASDSALADAWVTLAPDHTTATQISLMPSTTRQWNP